MLFPIPQERRSTLLGYNPLTNKSRLEFHRIEDHVVASLYREDEKKASCSLRSLSIQDWTYEQLPSVAKGKVDQFLRRNSLSLIRPPSPFRSPSPFSDRACGNSDSEFTCSGSEPIFFQKRDPISPAPMTIRCTEESGKQKNIKGSELIEIVHDEVQDLYDEVINIACEYEKDIGGPIIHFPREYEGKVFIRASKDWLMSLGGWKGMMPSEEVKNYFLYPKEQKFSAVMIHDNGLFFRLENHRLHIPEGFSIGRCKVTQAWVKKDGKFTLSKPKTDLSYNQITRVLSYISKTFRLSDSEIAKLQIRAITGRISDRSHILAHIPKTQRKEIIQFLDYLNALMFGVEASGLNAALITGVMTLDLISKERITYRQAFKANEDGGFYPYACFGNNKGSYNKRESILLQRKKERDPVSMKAFRKSPHHSPVAIKEAILIKEWLKCNQVIDPERGYEEQKKAIKDAIHDIYWKIFR